MELDDIKILVKPMSVKGIGRVKQFSIEATAGEEYERAIFHQHRNGDWNLSFPVMIGGSENALRCLIAIAAQANSIARPNYVPDFEI